MFAGRPGWCMLCWGNPTNNSVDMLPNMSEPTIVVIIWVAVRHHTQHTQCFFGTVKHAQLQVSVLTYSHTDGQWRRSVLGHRRDRKGCVRQHALGSRVQSLDFDWALIKTYQDFCLMSHSMPFQCFLCIVYCASNSYGHGSGWIGHHLRLYSLGHADTEHC